MFKQNFLSIFFNSRVQQVIGSFVVIGTGFLLSAAPAMAQSICSQSGLPDCQGSISISSPGANAAPGDITISGSSSYSGCVPREVRVSVDGQGLGGNSFTNFETNPPLEGDIDNWNTPAWTITQGQHTLKAVLIYRDTAGGGTCQIASTTKTIDFQQQCVPEQGQSCTSAPNVCGQTATGVIRCRGACSAVTPPDSNCNLNTNSGGGNSNTNSHPECTQTGDVTCDNKVDIADLSKLANYLRQDPQTPADDFIRQNGKITCGDTTVDQLDLTRLAQYLVLDPAVPTLQCMQRTAQNSVWGRSMANLLLGIERAVRYFDHIGLLPVVRATYAFVERS